MAISEPQVNGKNLIITESELDQALSNAVASDHVSVINVILYKHVYSPALRRLEAALAVKA